MSENGFQEGCRPKCGKCGEPWSDDCIKTSSMRTGSLTIESATIKCQNCGTVVYSKSRVYDTELHEKFGIRAL
jgi:uncharacterized Zn finger protein